MGLSCNDNDTTATFCADLATFRDEGPIFPAQADGARQPDLQALDRLRALADQAPTDLDDDFEVLVGAAEELVQEAQSHTESGSSFAASGRWSRSVVESAQKAVVEYAAETCDIDLAS